MKKLKSTIIIASSIFIFACNQGEYKEGNVIVESSSVELPAEYETPQTGNSDGDRKFIRTADLMFKVKDVHQSTEKLESITYKFGGFVTHTRLSSDIINSNITAISKDSSLETTYYSVTNDMTIRVPNTSLDTILKLISKNIEFLNYRVINAEDVALQMLSHQLAQKRYQSGKDIPSDGKVKNTILADEHDINKKEQYDKAMLANLNLDDKINFSTIKLSFYENNKIRRELIANEKNLSAYEPNLFSKMGQSLVNGWEIVEDFIVFILQFWAFILLAFYFIGHISNFGESIKNRFPN